MKAIIHLIDTSSEKRIAIMEILLNHLDSSYLNELHDDGTMLHIAVMSYDLPSVELLLRYGIDQDIVNDMNLKAIDLCDVMSYGKHHNVINEIRKIIKSYKNVKNLFASCKPIH